MKTTNGIAPAATMGIVTLLTCFAIVVIHVGTTLSDRFEPTPEKIERSTYDYSNVSMVSASATSTATTAGRPGQVALPGSNALEYYITNESLVGFETDCRTIEQHRGENITMQSR